MAGQIREFIESHLQDEKLSTEDLAHYLGISRSQLHRYVRRLFNCSTTALIRKVRIENAASLLKKGELTISEIAYKTGFSSPSYFNVCFHKVYGVTPGDFQKGSIGGMHEYYLPIWAKPWVKRGLIYIGLILVLVVTALFAIPTFNSSEDVTIAVLPFRLFTDDRSSGYLSETIAEEIRYSLSEYAELRVKSARSVRDFGTLAFNMKEIEKRYGVNHILEGRVQILRGIVTVFVQLINSEDEIVWSKRYRSEKSQVLNLPYEIGREVVDELPVYISANYEPAVATRRSHDIHAVELYQNGMKYIDQYSIRRQNELLKQARGCFERALLVDSAFAPAWVGLGEVQFILQLEVQDPAERNFHQVKEFIDKAFALDPTDAEAFDLLRRYYMFLGDYSTLLATLRKGVALNPNNSQLCQSLGENLTIVDSTFIEGIQWMHKAADLEKGGERWPDILRSMGWSFCHIGDYERSAYYFRLAGTFDPLIYYQNMAVVDNALGNFEAQIARTDSLCTDNEMDYRMCLERYAKAHYYAGNFDSAYQYLSRALSIMEKQNLGFKEYRMPWMAGFILYDAGYRTEAMEYLNSAIKTLKYDLENGYNLNHYTGAFELASIYAFLGDRKNSLKYLRKFADSWFIIGYHSWIDTMHFWEKFRYDPEFRTIIDQVNRRKASVRQQYDQLAAQGQI